MHNRRILHISLGCLAFFMIFCKSKMPVHDFNNPCDSLSVMVQFIDSTGEIVKSGVVGIDDPKIEENDFSIIEDTERIFEVTPSGCVCLPKNKLSKKYKVSNNDTLVAFYYKENYSYTSFELPLKRDTLSIKLLFYLFLNGK